MNFSKKAEKYRLVVIPNNGDNKGKEIIVCECVHEFGVKEYYDWHHTRYGQYNDGYKIYHKTFGSKEWVELSLIG